MRNDCPVRCLRTAFRTCRENPILSAANEKSGRKRLIYAICCDRIVIPIYGAFSSRRTAGAADIPGVNCIGGGRFSRRASHRGTARPTAFLRFWRRRGRISQSRSFPKAGLFVPKPKLSKSGFVRSRLSPASEAPPHRKTAVYHLHCRRGRRKGRIKWHHTEIFIHIPDSATDAIRWKKWRRRRSIRECTR